MAIKRTIGRSKFVQPTGIIPDSGGQAMAQASQNIANAITGITETIDKNQLDTAIIEAEKQGKQIGSRVDENNKPIPLDLTTLNSFTTNIYNKSNIKKASAYFKKQAINSYSLALQNDAIKNADASLQNNLGKVGSDGKLLVQTASEGYINSIKANVANEVWNDISPRLNNIWGNATRKASAFQIEETRKVNLNNAITVLETLLPQEANIISNGSSDESVVTSIAETKEKAFRLIDDNASSSVEVSNAKIKYSTNLQQLVSTNAIKLAHASGMSNSNLLKMAKSTSEPFATDKNVDSTLVYNAMINEISRLDKIDDEKKTEIKEVSLTSAYKMLLNLPKNVYPSESEIASLELEHQIKIIDAVNAQQKLIKTDTAKLFNNSVLKTISAVKNNNIGVVEQAGTDDNADFTSDDIDWLKKQKKMNMVKDLVGAIGHNLTKPSTEDKIYKLTKEIAEDFATESSDVFKANMTMAMNGNGKVLIPSQLRSASYIENLIKRDLIGTKNYHAYTRDGWINEVNRYEKEFIKTNKVANILSKIPIKQKFSIPINQEEKNALDKETPTSFYFNGKLTPYDVLSDDENVRQESVQFYTSLALSNGHLPNDLKDLFTNVQEITDDNVFSKLKQTYFSLKKEFYNKYKNQNPESKWEVFASKDRNNLNIDILDSTEGYANANEFRASYNNVSAKRNLSEIFPNLSEEGLSDNAIVTNELHSILEKSDNFFWQDWFTSDIDGNETENNVVRAWIDQNGGDFSTAVMSDPGILNQIIRGVKYRVASKKVNMNLPEKALRSAVKSEFYNMTGQLSLHTDNYGVVHLIKGNSAVREAQLLIPKDAYTITKEDLIEDVKSQYNKSFGGGSENTYIQKAIKDGNILFLPNNENVGQKTFRVVVEAEDGTAETLANHYRWQWEDSQVNADYKDALQKISNGGVRKLLSSFNFMSRNNLDAVMSTIKSNRESADTWIGIINKYNSLAFGVNNMTTSPNNILPIINYVKSDTGRKELEDYFDDKRFLRFDLR
jgi:hypothetical protein